MNYLHNSQNGLDNTTKKTFHRQLKMLLENIMVDQEAIQIMRMNDEGLTAQDEDLGIQEGREVPENREGREAGLGVLKGLGNYWFYFFKTKQI